MKPRVVAAVSGMLLAGLLSAPAMADPVTRFEDHHIGFFCEQSVEAGGILVASIDVSSFGDSGGAELWLDPAIPFEDPPTLSGGSDQVTLGETADGFSLSVQFAVFDANGEAVGDGSIDASLVRDGEPTALEDERFGNRTSFVEGTFQAMAVTGTLSLPGMDPIELGPCGGDETFITVKETNPHTFVIDNRGIAMNCFWETDDAVAGLFVIDDSFGEFGDTFLNTPEGDLFTAGTSSLELTTESMSVAFDLFDPANGDSATAVAEASLTPVGDPVTSVVLSATSRDKVVEQLFSASGELTFSTDQAFTIDDTACFTNTFDSHFVDSGPSGPKTGGKAPANDTPEGAIPLVVGSQLNQQTGGTAIEPELPSITCDEGEQDRMGRTLWYTFEGTGGEVSLDTAGSNFDTFLTVYVRDGEEFIEIACVDDVFFEPIGLSFQAAISGPSEAGVTYWIQIGGFDARQFGGEVEFGRLHVEVD